jgi:hypothetical protein
MRGAGDILWLLLAAIPALPVTRGTSSMANSALSLLYHSTQGSLWTSKDSWMTNDPCDNAWYGITCSNDDVVQIDLANNNLQGSIPSEVGWLTRLTEGGWSFSGTYWEPLFAGNTLTSTLPTEIGKWTGLTQRLGFSDNKLTGTMVRVSTQRHAHCLIANHECNLTSPLSFLLSCPYMHPSADRARQDLEARRGLLFQRCRKLRRQHPVRSRPLD